MKVQDQLKQTLDATPDLSLVAFGDLSSGLILNWSAKTPCPREVLDLLGEKAAACFAVLHGAALPPGAAPGAALVHFTEQESHIFARHPANADDVICAVAEPGARLEPLLRSATDLAARLAVPE
jgi:hypothetical protein